MNSEVNCKILNLGDGAKRESIAASFDSNSLYYSTESNLKKGINGSHDQGKTIFSAQLPNEEFIYVYSKNDYKILPSYTGSTIFQISSQHYAFPNYAYAPQLNSTVHYSNDNGHTFKLILVSPTEFLGGAISDDGDVLLLLTNGEGIWRVETSQEVNDHEITVITKFTDAPSTYWVGIACNSRCSKAVAIAGEPDVCRSSAGSGIYLTMDGRSFSFVQLAKHLHSVVATADFAFMAASSYSTLYYSVDYGYSWMNVEFSGYSGLGIVENSLITLRPPNRSNLIMDDVLEIPIPPPILETYNCANFGSWNQVNYIILALIGEIVLFYIVYQYYYHIGYEMGHLLFYYQKRPTVGFISHNWFDGERNRTPHIRARQLKDALERINLSMWFDEKSMHYRIFRSIDHGIRHSKVVIVCITRQYIKKVNSRDANDACFYELNRTSTSKIIPLLMEPGLEGSTLITRGFIGEKIEGLQYLDFSCNFNSEPLRFEEAIQELQTCIGERIAGLQPIEN